MHLGLEKHHMLQKYCSGVEYQTDGCDTMDHICMLSKAIPSVQLGLTIAIICKYMK